MKKSADFLNFSSNKIPIFEYFKCNFTPIFEHLFP
nr:MAG TPA: hypothetical protein [Caudoviricetes sp.]